MVIFSTIGSIIVFSIFKKNGSEYVDKILSKHKLLQAIAGVILYDSFKISLLLRLSPISFGIGNAVLGSMKIKFHPYVVATLIGLIKNIFPVYMGNSLKELSKAKENSSLKQYILIMFITSFLLFVILSVYVYFQLKKVLRNLDIETSQHIIEDVDDILEDIENDHELSDFKQY